MHGWGVAAAAAVCVRLLPAVISTLEAMVDAKILL
jgi:hypothetical protein